MMRIILIIFLFYVSFVSGQETTIDQLGENSTQGMTGLWHSNEGAGINIKDTVNSNDGTAQNVNWATGRFETAMDFNGNDDYVEIPANPSFYDTFDASWSFVMWVKITSYTKPLQAGHVVLFCKPYHAPETSPWYNIRLYLSQANNWIDLLIQGTGGTEHLLARKTSYSLATGVWIFITATYDHPNTMLKLYENGVLLAYDNTTSGPTTSPRDTGAGLSVNLPFKPEFPLYGQIDEFAIFDRCLTIEEINDLYTGITD